mgnify:CR=1 FL=1
MRNWRGKQQSKRLVLWNWSCLVHLSRPFGAVAWEDNASMWLLEMLQLLQHILWLAGDQHSWAYARGPRPSNIWMHLPQRTELVRQASYVLKWRHPLHQGPPVEVPIRASRHGLQDEADWPYQRDEWGNQEHESYETLNWRREEIQQGFVQQEEN